MRNIISMVILHRKLIKIVLFVDNYTIALLTIYGYILSIALQSSALLNKIGSMIHVTDECLRKSA